MYSRRNRFTGHLLDARVGQRYCVALLVGLVLLLSACSNLPFSLMEGRDQSGTDGSDQVEVFAPATITPGPMPAVKLQLLSGGQASLEKWRGQGIILNFWASWCYPCRIEMPELVKVHRAHDDIVVVGVNYLESADEAQSFVDELELPFPILLDTKGELGNKLNVRALPTTFFIDKQGRIIGSHLGPVTSEMVEEIIPKMRSR